jgi:GNAT superfamily N-acetyltransferase
VSVSAAGYRIEPLQPSYDRTGFRCDVPELDSYLRSQASQDARRNVAAPFVMLDPSGVIVGYYTLSAYALLLSEVPPAVAQKLPRYPRLPATLLGRLAVSADHRGRNLGRLLLMDALHRSWRNSAEVASMGVVVDIYDESAKAFSLHHEFLPLLDHSNRLFLAMATIEEAFGKR